MQMFYLGEKYPVLLKEIEELIQKEVIFEPGEGLNDQYADLQLR